MASTFGLQPMDKQPLYLVRLEAVFVSWSSIIHKVSRRFIFFILPFLFVFRFNAYVFSLSVVSLRRDLNKNLANPCSYYLRHVLEKTRLK